MKDLVESTKFLAGLRAPLLGHLLETSLPPPFSQISILVEEKNTLSLENKSLREQKSSLESDAAGLTGKKLLLLQTQIEQLQEENFR